MKKTKLFIIITVIAALLLGPEFVSAATFRATANTTSLTTIYVQKGKTVRVYGRFVAAGDKIKSWRSSKSAIATVGKTGLVRGKKAGAATITVTTTKGKKDTIKVKVVTKRKKAKSIRLAKTKTLKARGVSRVSVSISPANATESLVWRSSNRAVATVTPDGYVTGKKAGKAVITVRTSSGRKASCVLTIKDPVTISATSKSIREDKTTTLSASAASGAVRWSSSNTAIATVSQKGVVTPKQRGSVTITATSVASNTKASCKLTIIPHIPATGITVTPTSKTILGGSSTKVSYRLESSDASLASNDLVTWTTSNPRVATVDSSGAVKGVGFGKATITAVAESGVRAACTITVKTIAPKRETVTLTPGVQYYVQNLTYGIGANPKLTYTTSDKSLATVDSSGLVSVNQRDADGEIRIGVVHITAKTPAGDTAVTKITIAGVPTIIDVSKFQGDIDWTKVAKSVDLAILRASNGQHAADYEPKYPSYSLAAQSRGLPYGAYHFAMYTTKAEAEKEATIFYNAAYAGSREPAFLVVDCERDYLNRANTETFIEKLRSLAGYRIKVGVYVANHLYTKMNLNLTTNTSNDKTPDFVWIPTYGSNEGSMSSATVPKYPLEIWQYSSKGRIPGIKGDVDMNTIFAENGNKLSKKSTFDMEWLCTPAQKP